MIYENTPTIKTERLILRRFTENDAESLFYILKEEQTNTFLPWFTLKTLDEAKTFLKSRFLLHYHKSSAYRYAVCLKEYNIPIGYVWLADDESNDFGYCLKRDYWHKRITTEASKAIVSKINHAGYPYITATHDINNPRSGEVMKKLGMTYKYSYVEQWQPKNFPVTFRMYQLNFDGNINRIYNKYWDMYREHFVEENV